jgi:hypothetical protein
VKRRRGEGMKIKRYKWRIQDSKLQMANNKLQIQNWQ